MIQFLICLAIGHKKYTPHCVISNKGDFIRMEDALGHTLIAINVCERCGKLYTSLEQS
jgi:hypothetical protein